MEDYVKMDLDAVCDAVDWIYLAQERDQCLALVNMVMNIQIPLKDGNIYDQLSNF
jgi:hypothetical protein